MESPETILILGASVRAAAASAIRAGLRPVCADYFADRDLSALCPVVRIPHDRQPIESIDPILAFARPHGVSGWMYTGPFENHPDLVDRLSAVCPLRGNSGPTLRAVRSPFQVAGCLSRAGFPVPELRADPRNLPRDGSWLVKSLSSGGGLGVEPLKGESNPRTDPAYYQRKIPGPSHSALYVGSLGRARLIGVSQQFHGIPGRPFIHRGNIGPIRLDPAIETQLAGIGQILAAAFGLVGIFGIDFVLSGYRPWILEVNPRYTASVEIFELAYRSPLLREHGRVCDSESSDPGRPLESGAQLPAPRVVGKWILYAMREFDFPDVAVPDRSSEDSDAIPEIADIPEVGSRIRRDDPVMTVFGAGMTPRGCFVQLRSAVRGWRRRLGHVR